MTASLADYHLLRLAQLCRERVWIRGDESISFLLVQQRLESAIEAAYRSCVDSGCEPEARIILDCWQQEGVKE